MSGWLLKVVARFLLFRMYQYWKSKININKISILFTGGDPTRHTFNYTDERITHYTLSSYTFYIINISFFSYNETNSSASLYT